MHHSDNDLPKDVRRELFGTISEKLGPTGRFPLGKFTPSDEGEIAFAIRSDPAQQKVLIDFGKPVCWVGMTPTQARELAATLKSHARRASGVIENGQPDKTDMSGMVGK